MFALLLCVAANGESYMLFDHWGGTWCDAEKSPASSEDDLMCWAAAASNVLQWTQWGEVDGMTTSDEMFAYFQDHWTDEGGKSEFGWQWWLSGVNPRQGSDGWSQVDVPGGHFFPSEDFYEYYHSRAGSSVAMAAIDSYLHSGYGTALALYGPGGHTVTCWGLNYNPSSPSEYYGIWITDSDDDAGSTSPPDRLRYYEVDYRSEMWYVQGLYGSNSWHIDLVQGLEPREPTWPPPATGGIQGIVFDDANGNGAYDGGESRLANRIVYLDSNNNGQWDEASVTVASTEAPKEITDHLTAFSTLTVDAIGSITDLNVTLDIAHTYDWDLTVELVSPSGTMVELFSHVGGSGDNFTNTTLDDEAATSITDAFAPFSGTFRPEGSLDDFDGENTGGTWTLRTSDDGSGDTGTLNSWSLEITTEETIAQTNEQGEFEFAGLEDGSYTVRHAPDDGWNITCPGSGYYAVNIEEGAVVEEIDFGVSSGDLDGDGFVGGADLDIVRGNWGQYVTAGSRLRGDPSCDGFVGGDDLDIVQAHWGEGTPPDIPEPSIAIMLVIGGLLLSVCQGPGKI